MAKIGYETVCPCGERLAGHMKKPTLIERSVAPIKCRVCGSRFLMVSQRIRGEAGRLINTEIEIIELTTVAKKAIESKLPGPIRAAAIKIGLIRVPDTSTAIVETEMDTPAE